MSKTYLLTVLLAGWGLLLVGVLNNALCGVKQESRDTG